VLVLPWSALLLLLGVTGGRVLGGVVLPLPLALGIGEDGSNRLLSGGKVGGDVQELARIGGGLATQLMDWLLVGGS
jgi:hypothetical protein